MTQLQKQLNSDQPFLPSNVFVLIHHYCDRSSLFQLNIMVIVTSLCGYKVASTVIQYGVLWNTMHSRYNFCIFSELVMSCNV